MQTAIRKSHHRLLIKNKFNAIWHKTTPETFQSALDIILSSVKWQFARVYKNDIEILWRSMDDHHDHVQQFLTSISNDAVALRGKNASSSRRA